MSRATLPLPAPGGQRPWRRMLSACDLGNVLKVSSAGFASMCSSRARGVALGPSGGFGKPPGGSAWNLRRGTAPGPPSPESSPQLHGAAPEDLGCPRSVTHPQASGELAPAAWVGDSRPLRARPVPSCVDPRAPPPPLAPHPRDEHPLAGLYAEDFPGANHSQRLVVEGPHGRGPRRQEAAPGYGDGQPAGGAL